MDFLFYFIGPLLAVGLPLSLLVASAVLGIRAAGIPRKLLLTPVALLVYAALVVPARSLSMNGWPGPWWMAAYLGNFNYEWTLMLLLALVAVSIFFIAAWLRASIQPRSERAGHAPASRRYPPPR